MKFYPVNSTNIAEAGFERGKCQVRFKSGGLYEYDGISEETWNHFQATFDTKESSTKFFRKFIQKPKFKRIA